jgi:predicted DNA-binding mobile mystery protein A
MSVQSKQLGIHQLDQVLSKLKQIDVVPRPRNGWLQAIRKTLGMSAKQLGDRVGMFQAAIAKLEKREIEGGTTLATMEKVAAGLDCSFVYALVPNTTLQDFIEKKAREVAIRRVRGTSHSMSLESQSVADEQTELQIKMFTDEILATLPRHMWNEDGF